MPIWETIKPLWSGAEQGGGSPTPNQDKAGVLYPPGQEPKPEAEKSATEKPAEPAPPATETEKSATETEKSADEKVPEGDYEVRGLEKDQQIDKDALALFQPAAKEIGLTQAQFDRLSPIYPKIVETIVKRQSEQNAETIKAWEVESREDKEIGGQKFAENIGLCSEVIKAYGTPELRQIIDDSGFGNHKEFLRFLYRIGKDRQKEPDGSVKGSPPGKESAAQILYGGTPQR